MIWLAVAVGAVLLALVAYGLIRDFLRYRNIQIADSPEPARYAVNLSEALRRAGPEPRRYPSGPWSPAEQHQGKTRLGIDEDDAA